MEEFLEEVTECQGDEVYGQRFRNVMRVVDTFGFKTTRDHIVKNGSLHIVPLAVMYSTSHDQILKELRASLLGI